MHLIIRENTKAKNHVILLLFTKVPLLTFHGGVVVLLYSKVYTVTRQCVVTSDVFFRLTFRTIFRRLLHSGEPCGFDDCPLLRPRPPGGPPGVGSASEHEPDHSLGPFCEEVQVLDPTVFVGQNCDLAMGWP